MAKTLTVGCGGAVAQSVLNIRKRARLVQVLFSLLLDSARLDGDFFDEKSKEWRDQQKQVEEQMAQVSTTGMRSATEAVQTMKAVSDACAGFEQAQPQQQRFIATALLKNATWKAGGMPVFGYMTASRSHREGDLELVKMLLGYRPALYRRNKSPAYRRRSMLLPAWHCSGEPLVDVPERHLPELQR
jgi:hypothetical protein